MDLRISPLDLSHDIISSPGAMRYDLGVSAAVTVSRTSSSRSRIAAGWVGGRREGERQTIIGFFQTSFYKLSVGDTLHSNNMGLTIHNPGKFQELFLL